MRKLLLLSLIFICACASSKYETVNIYFQNGAKVKAEIADTPEKQVLGLMYREHLALNKAMIFPYNQQETRSFWMKNTLIDLDIIFISDQQTINCVIKNVPKSTLFTADEDVATATCPAKYVLELAAGAADKYKLEPGQTVGFKIK